MIILKLFTVILLTLFLWLMLQLLIGAFKVFRMFSFIRSGMQQATAQKPNPNQRQQPHQHTVGQNTMVKCSACHLYVLDSDAITRNGMAFCSPEHARRD
jgi:hypothetical protein